MTQIEHVARLLCEFDDCDPDTSLGGDKQNWFWHEYSRMATNMLKAGYTISVNLEVEP